MRAWEACEGGADAPGAATGDMLLVVVLEEGVGVGHLRPRVLLLDRPQRGRVPRRRLRRALLGLRRRRLGLWLVGRRAHVDDGLGPQEAGLVLVGGLRGLELQRLE